MAQKITYQDPGGNAVVGYLINGKTYKDPSGTQRIDAGSVVVTPDAKQWLMTDGGGIEIAKAASNPYKQYMDELTASTQLGGVLGYQLKQQQLANDQATAASVSRLNAQKPLVIAERDAAAQNAYIQNMQNLRRMPQMQKAMGITGGLSESALLASQANYENKQANIYRDAQNQLNSIDMAIADAKTAGAVNNANLAADYYGQLANLELQASQNATDLARERANTLAKYGIFTGYSDLGYSDADITGMENAYRQALAAQRSSSNGGGTPVVIADPYSEMANAGITDEAGAYAWAIANGYSSTEATKLAEYFVNDSVAALPSIVKYAWERALVGTATESDKKLLIAYGLVDSNEG